MRSCIFLPGVKDASWPLPSEFRNRDANSSNTGICLKSGFLCWFILKLGQRMTHDLYSVFQKFWTRHPIYISFNKNRSALFRTAAIPIVVCKKCKFPEEKCIIHFQCVNQERFAYIRLTQRWVQLMPITWKINHRIDTLHNSSDWHHVAREIFWPVIWDSQHIRISFPMWAHKCNLATARVCTLFHMHLTPIKHIFCPRS